MRSSSTRPSSSAAAAKPAPPIPTCGSPGSGGQQDVAVAKDPQPGPAGLPGAQLDPNGDAPSPGEPPPDASADAARDGAGRGVGHREPAPAHYASGAEHSQRAGAALRAAR